MAHRANKNLANFIKFCYSNFVVDMGRNSNLIVLNDIQSDLLCNLKRLIVKKNTKHMRILACHSTGERTKCASPAH